MNTYIGVHLEVEGIHRWKGVMETPYKDEMSYLVDFHRHNFIIDCEMKVHHDDRDKEFISLKHDIMSYLRQEFWSTQHQLCWFGDMSCEMIARLLLEKFGLTKCKVSEDGENYAIIINND